MSLLGYLYEPQENIEETIKIVSDEMNGTLTTIHKQNPEINTVQGLIEYLLKTIESVKINQKSRSEYGGQYMTANNLDIHYKVESTLDKIQQKYAHLISREKE
jgi:hypothetical protein